MAQAFISYSRRDSDTVDQLVNALETAKYTVWVDRGRIRGGDQWRRQIVSAIEKSDVFIIVLSSDSVKSVNVRGCISR
jgi:hypothetical protein